MNNEPLVDNCRDRRTGVSRGALAALVPAALLLTGGCFYAADQGRKLEDKLLRIEHDQVNPEELNKRLSQMETREDQVRLDIDSMRQSLQEQIHALETIRQNQDAGMMERSVLDSRLQQIEESLKSEQSRMSAMEKVMGVGKTGGKKPGQPEMGSSITPSVAADVPQGNGAFSMIMANLQAGEWVKAREGIEAVLARDPSQREKAQATLLMGHLHFRQKAYSDAILVFDDVAKKFADFPEAAEALYYEGRSFLEKGNADTAAAFFKKLIKRYPDSPFRPKAQADLKQSGDQ